MLIVPLSIKEIINVWSVLPLTHGIVLINYQFSAQDFITLTSIDSSEWHDWTILTRYTTNSVHTFATQLLTYLTVLKYTFNNRIWCVVIVSVEHGGI